MRRWELVSGGSAKFWEIDRDGTAVTVRFGRLQTSGQTQTKELASAEAAQAHVAKLVAEKEKKGYREVGASAAPAADPAAGSAVDPTAGRPATGRPAPASATQTATPTTDRAGAAPVADRATTTSPAGRPAPVDEDTWVMPKVWLRDVIRRRGFDPAPVFSVDPELADEARRRVDEHAATIELVLSEPTSEPDLVQAAREHRAGRPNPVGAAAIAAIAKTGPQSVHAWIADHGVVFAAEATMAFVGLVSTREWLRQQHSYGKERLRSRGGYLHVTPDGDEGRMLTAVRYALAIADDAEHAAAEAALDRLTEDAAKFARVYLMPGRADWFAEACRLQQGHTRWWLLACSATRFEEFERARARPTNAAFIMHTAIHVLGPAIAPLLAQDLDHSYQRADGRKQALKVLAMLPTDEAFTILLDRLDAKYVRPALLEAMAAFPARAARLLGERAAGDDEVRQLLTVHLTKHPHLEAPAGFTAIEDERVPAAPPEALPPLLVSPPWVNRKPPLKAVVVPDLPLPSSSITWEPGEREEWLKAGLGNSRYTWQELLEQFHQGRVGYRVRDLFALAPVDEVRHLLADWEPRLHWNAEATGKLLAARFGFDALPPLLRLVESNVNVAVVVLPFATPEVAALMADWLVRLKQVRKVALAWLARHRETAARLLVPAALGKPGAGRRNAETAIRHLHGMGVDVVALAPGPEAADALRAFLAVDPVDVLPTRLPVLGEWAEPRLLPQVLLRDRGHALPAEAASHLLMMAALSKPGDVYAGLPVVREALDRDSLAEFAWAVFQRWQEVGAPSKEGWAFTALGWFGDDETVRRLSPLIRTWPGESQHTRAVAGLDVLADIGTEVALSHLNGIAEKVKFKALKTRAQEKVSQIAAELGLSRDQLADRLVPRLGLDDEASLVIDYGPRRFTVGFDEQLKPFVLDQDGKRRKDLPKPGAKDDQDQAPLEHKRFMALKKDVRTVAGDQIHRLERAMVSQRTWTAEEFHAVLAGHPLLWHIVRRLVWITNEGLSFRLAEDRTLADENDDEFSLPEDATVRVAHPVDLRDSLEAWGEVFADYEILQPFPQLSRPLHVVPPGEDLLARLAKYDEVPYPVGKVLGLTNKGWVRGQPQDAGVECWITRPFPGGGALVASLDPGIAVGAVDIFPEVKFTGLWFSADGEGDWSAPKNAPAMPAADPITVSELLSELESLQA
ncbi:WGR domain-containing protein, predicted DNA-binding domain in MolR [Lentzea xinjiangensis]|uniref:WGR domain-containing protein, predicted DNA-binding domain in MolR n=1 Tax=Lentzea xinjiangensis TaxID=402600 RepID=A0A1H9REN7_9PSEU|nr:DUF4132 domain-containing protein [Lentzea xinjiangensis]SER71311.1 WGR domain-containing protein, predicted DNA-binding domain in MolR [Lentzea xinjiangensis]